MSLLLRALALPALLALALPSAQAAPSFNLTDLGLMPGMPFLAATDVNASGQVAGFSYNSFSTGHAYRYSGGTLTDLGTLGGSQSVGMDINAGGNVVGYAMRPGDTQVRAVVHNGTTMLDLGTLGGTSSWGRAINDSHWVVGESMIAGNTATHAFLYQGGPLIDLGTLGGSFSVGLGINAAGWSTGYAARADGTVRAFLHNGAAMIDLGTLGGANSYGYGINTAGWVTGQAQPAGGGDYRPFLRIGATMIDLGTLGGTYGAGLDINSAGWVVGTSTTVTNLYRAFLHDGGALYDLNDLIASDDPLKHSVTLRTARGLNDSGMIVAESTDGRAYLLTPVVAEVATTPEPASLALLGTSLLGLGLLRRRPA